MLYTLKTLGLVDLLALPSMNLAASRSAPAIGDTKVCAQGPFGLRSKSSLSLIEQYRTTDDMFARG